MILTLIFEGAHHRFVRLDSSKSLHDLLCEFCEKRKLDPSNFSLWHDRDELPLTSSLSILDSNSKLRIQPRSSSSRHGAAKRGDSIVRIAIEREGKARLTGKFSSHKSLWSVLEEFCEKDKVNLLQVYDSKLNFMIPVLQFRKVKLDSIEKLWHFTLREFRVSGGGIVIHLVFQSSSLKAADVSAVLAQLADEDVQKRLAQADVDENKNQQSNQTEADVVYGSPVSQSDIDKLIGRIDRHVTTLCRKARGAELDGALKILKKITSNLMKRPPNPKHRILRLSNETLQEKLFRFPSTVSYLKCLGFVEDSTGALLELPSPHENLKIVIEALKILDNAVPRFEDEKSEEIPEISRRMKVFHVDELRKSRAESVNLDDVANEVELTPEMAREERKLLRQGFADDQRKTNQLNPGFFLSREKIESMKVRRQYKEAIIRVQFPSRIVIEACFHPQETIGVIMDFIHQCLAPEFAAKRFLLRLPPKTDLKDVDVTIRSAQLLPAATLYFLWPSSDGDPMDVDKGILLPEVLSMIGQNVPSTVPEAINAREASRQPDFDFKRKLGVRDKTKKKKANVGSWFKGH